MGQKLEGQIYAHTQTNPSAQKKCSGPLKYKTKQNKKNPVLVFEPFTNCNLRLRISTSIITSN